MEDHEKTAAELNDFVNKQPRRWKGIEILHDNGNGVMFRETGLDMDPLAGDTRGPEGTTGTAVSVTTRGNVITIDLYAVRRYR